MSIENKLSFDLPTNYTSWKQLYDEVRMKSDKERSNSGVMTIWLNESKGSKAKLDSFAIDDLEDNVVQELTYKQSSEDELKSILAVCENEYPELVEKINLLIQQKYHK